MERRRAGPLRRVHCCLYFGACRYSRRGWAVAKVAADAAKQSAEIARDSLVLLQRPFVFAAYRWLWHEDWSRPGRYWYSVHPILENSGSTPTRELKVNVAFRLSELVLPDDFDFPLPSIHAMATLIGPRGKIEVDPWTLTDEDLAAVQSGSKHFYVWGKAEYLDGFNGTPLHTTKFCTRISHVGGLPSDPVLTPGSKVGSSVEIRFEVYPQHNSAD